MSNETYVECSVLIAVMDGDIDEADRLLADFYDLELRTFHDQVGLLEQQIRKARRSLREGKAQT